MTPTGLSLHPGVRPSPMKAIKINCLISKHEFQLLLFCQQCGLNHWGLHCACEVTRYDLHFGVATSIGPQLVFFSRNVDNQQSGRTYVVFFGVLLCWTPEILGVWSWRKWYCLASPVLIPCYHNNFPQLEPFWFQSMMWWMQRIHTSVTYQQIFRYSS